MHSSHSVQLAHGCGVPRRSAGPPLMTAVLVTSPCRARPNEPGADQRLDERQPRGAGMAIVCIAHSRHGVTKDCTRPGVALRDTSRLLLDEFRRSAEWPPACVPAIGAGLRSGAGMYRIAHTDDPLELRDCRGELDPGHPGPHLADNGQVRLCRRGGRCPTPPAARRRPHRRWPGRAALPAAVRARCPGRRPLS